MSLLYEYEVAIAMSDEKVFDILYLEDNPDDVFLLKLALKKLGNNFRLTHVSTGSDYEKAIEDPRHLPDIIISDYILHSYSGLDALLYLRQRSEVTPFMFLSGTLGEETAVQLMLKGANDFLLKENISRIPKQILKLLDEANAKREKLKYQRELENKNNILKTLLESMQDFIFLKDENRRYITVNRSMCEHYNLTSQMFIGATDDELFAPEIASKSAESDDYVLTNNKSILYEISYMNYQGLRKIIETLKAPLQNREGQTRGIVGVSRDITAKKLQEEEIRRNEELLNESEKQSNSGSFQYDPVNDRLIGSRQFMKMLGLSGDESREMSLSGFITCIYPPEKGIFVKQLYRALNNRKSFTMEHRLMPTDGKKIVHCKTTLLQPKADNSQIFYGSIKDIYEDRKNKKAIIDAQENERRDLAAELHDGLTQKLVAATMYLSSMHENNMNLDRIRIASDLIRSGLEETRRLTRSLSLHNFENLGFKNSLLEIIESFPTNISINHEFDFDEKKLDKEVASSVYRVIQEALTNIMKYAKASKVGIIMKSDEEVLRCKVIDDGIGFDTMVEEARGNGLKNIRQRIQRCNGFLSILSSDGEGTTISFSVPFK